MNSTFYEAVVSLHHYSIDNGCNNMLGCNIDSYTNMRGHGCSSRLFQRTNKYFEVRSALQLMICKINFIDKSIINTKTLNSPDRLIISNPVQLEEHRETNVFRMHSSASKIYKISKHCWFNATLCHFIYAKMSQRWSQKNSPVLTSSTERETELYRLCFCCRRSAQFLLLLTRLSKSHSRCKHKKVFSCKTEVQMGCALNLYLPSGINQTCSFSLLHRECLLWGDGSFHFVLIN